MKRVFSLLLVTILLFCFASIFSQKTLAQTVTAHVFVDYNDNGVQDINGQGGYTGPTEPDYQGATISYSGPTINGTNTTDASGDYQITGIPAADTETISVTAPSGWTVTTDNPVDATSDDSVVNFGIQPPAPSCSDLTATSPIYLGQTSPLTFTCIIGGGNGTLNYTWSINSDPNSPTDPGDGNRGNVVTSATGYSYAAPAAGSWFQPFIVDVTVTACNPGATPETEAGITPVCISKYMPITVNTVNPLYSVSGNVYTDSNKNGVYDPPPPPPGESVYSDQSLPITVCPNYANPSAQAEIFCPALGGTALNTTGGTYNTGFTLPPGTYTVSINGLPKTATGQTDASYKYSGSHAFQVTLGN